METFTWPVRIYYEDTDAGGLVYHANYLKFMERARTEWLRARGYELDALARDSGVAFVVRALSIEYLKPARFNDLVQVTAAASALARTSLAFDQQVLRAHNGAAQQVLAKARIGVVCLAIDSFRPCPIPQCLLQDLKSAN